MLLSPGCRNSPKTYNSATKYIYPIIVGRFLLKICERVKIKQMKKWVY